ncbi:MAG: hypothetical protein IPF99_06295 [Deltaproteobacteria bacterium]|nr:hypothetical protein [Deltaproteobacteria bacterium]
MRKSPVASRCCTATMVTKGRPASTPTTMSFQEKRLATASPPRVAVTTVASTKPSSMRAEKTHPTQAPSSAARRQSGFERSPRASTTAKALSVPTKAWESRSEVSTARA